MKNRSLLVAAIWTALAQPVAAQPGATEPNTSNVNRDDEGDGPEAQAILPIKIDDLIEVAVRLSPDLSRARVDRVAAMQAADGSRRDQIWVLGADITYTRQGTADHVDVAPYALVATNKVDTDVTLARQLPTGGSIQFQFGFTQSDNEYNVPDSTSAAMGSGAMDPSQFAEEQIASQAQLGFSYTQPLMRGLGSSVALANEHKADLAALDATVKAQVAAEKLIQDIVSSYWELAYSAYALDVRMQAIELGKKQEELTHEQLRAGKEGTNSINSVNFDIAQRQGELLSAQIDVEQKSLELREKAGLELSKRQILMHPSEAFEIGVADFNVDEVLARAKVANHQLAELLIQKKIADIDVLTAEDQTKAKLDFQLQAAITGNGDDSGGAFDSLTGGAGFQIAGGLKLSVELSGAARKMRDAAVSKRRGFDFDIAKMQREIETQTVTAVHTVTAARQKIALDEKSISVAEDNVRAERNNFMVGRSTNLQVMQTQQRLIQARLDRGRAIADYHKAVAQLQFLSGTLLEQYRVNVHPHR